MTLSFVFLINFSNPWESNMDTYNHGQELFYKFVSKITNKLVKQLLAMTVHAFRSCFSTWTFTVVVLKITWNRLIHCQTTFNFFKPEWFCCFSHSAYWKIEKVTLNCKICRENSYSWFHGIFAENGESQLLFHTTATVWKNTKFTLTCQIIRENIFYVV